MKDNTILINKAYRFKIGETVFQINEKGVLSSMTRYYSGLSDEIIREILDSKRQEYETLEQAFKVWQELKKKNAFGTFNIKTN